MKQHIINRLLTVLFALCAIVLAVLTVISLIPPAVDSGLTVKETIFVSSSPQNAEKTSYVSQIQGILINESDEELIVDALKIKVSDGKTEREMLWDGFKLPPRVSYDLLYEWQGTHDYERIYSVTAVIGGVEEPLANATAGMPFDFGTVILLVLCAISAMISLHFGKQCYYLIQEEQIKKSIK